MPLKQSAKSTWTPREGNGETQSHPGSGRSGILCQLNLILRMIPKISGEEVERWITERSRKPFSGVKDFKIRSALSEATTCALGLPQ